MLLSYISSGSPCCSPAEMGDMVGAVALQAKISSFILTRRGLQPCNLSKLGILGFRPRTTTTTGAVIYEKAAGTGGGGVKASIACWIWQWDRRPTSHGETKPEFTENEPKVRNKTKLVGRKPVGLGMGYQSKGKCLEVLHVRL